MAGVIRLLYGPKDYTESNALSGHTWSMTHFRHD